MGKIIPLPDMEYRCWCNLNKEALENIMKTGIVNTIWISKNNNGAYLKRWFKERGLDVSF